MLDRGLTVGRDGELRRSGEPSSWRHAKRDRLTTKELAELKRLVARTRVTTFRNTTARKCLISKLRWSHIVVRARGEVRGTYWGDCLENPGPRLLELVRWLESPVKR